MKLRNNADLKMQGYLYPRLCLERHRGCRGVLARRTECSEVHSGLVMLEGLASAAEEMPIYSRTCLNRAWVCSRS